VIMSQSKGNITFKDVQGDISGIAAAGETQTFTGSILGDISGIVANTINQLPVSPDPSHPGARELLSQLQGLIESEEALSEDDKALALEQVNVLAEAAQKPEEGALKRAAKTSMLVLKGLVAGLPDVTEFASAVRDLLTTLGGLLCWV
ncbi:MAG: hypothetical protein QNJ46_16190, partial [Leptolyngbyaceae cyanobacterium MO_188.B28]|nr:hypothetical protein [Leptolyngbyaceae cyanobacterium MO_188.B28]